MSDLSVTYLRAVRVGDQLVFPGFENPPSPPFGVPRVVLETLGGHPAAAQSRLAQRMRRLVDEARLRSRDGRVYLLEADYPEVRHTRNGIFLARWEFGLHVEEKS